MILVVAAAVFGAVRTCQEQTRGTGPVADRGAQDEPARDVAFIANAVDGTVTLIDLSERRVAGMLNIIPDGPRAGVFRDARQALIGQRLIESAGGLNYAQDTDVSRDGRVLYVARGHLGDVAAFDIASGELAWRLPVAGARADHMALTPNGRRLFVAAMTSGVVEAIDTRTARKLGSFETGDWPHDMHVSEDGRRVFNASIGDMTQPEQLRDGVSFDGDAAYQVTVADVGGLEVIDRHRFAAGIRPFQLSPDEDLLYAQLSNRHVVIRYDMETREVSARLELPVADGVTVDDYDFEAPHHGLAMTEDGSRLCIAARASDYAALVSAPELELITTTPVGDAPSWAAISPDQNLCVIANNRSDDVSLIDMESGEEVARLPAGRAPKHVTIARVPDAVLQAVAGR
ncbi:MAG: serine/threonine protein kinase [Pseudomonadota bacterium]